MVELLVAVAIIAILTASAMPSYAGYVSRSRIGDALGPLAQYRLQMEQASQDNGNYGLTACAMALPSDTAYFRFACTVGGNGQTFVATATGQGTMTAYAFAINQTGMQTTSAFPGRSALPATCWLARASDC